MDLGGQLVSEDAQVIEALQAELDKIQGSAGGGGTTKDAPSLSADNVGTGSAVPMANAVVVGTTNPVPRVVSATPSPQKHITVQNVAGGNVSKTPTVGTKRPLVNSTSGAPMVTKVIITKNPGSNQPQVVPIHLGSLQAQGVSVTSLAPGMNVIPHMPNQGSMTPTKTITISSQGIVSTAGKQILTNLGGTPTKIVNKIPISPAKTPPKITMIPVSLAKSPQRGVIAPASSVVVARPLNAATSNSMSGTTVVASTGNMKPATITMSPTKVILKQSNQQINKLPIGISAATSMTTPLSQLGLPASSTSGVQQISVPGSKFHYVRLVTPTTQTSTSSTVLKTAGGQMVQVKPIAPATVSSSTATAAQQVRLTVPVQSTQPVAIRPAVSTPAQAVTQIRPVAPVTTASNTGFSQLPPGTTIISSTGNIPGVQGYALVPAQYVNQLRQQINKPQQQQTRPPSPPVAVRTDYVPIASSDPMITASTLARNVTNGTTIEATGARPRKPCNCTKSQCLKLYCDCFANGEFCHNCNCTNCANNLEHEEGRSRAIKACLDRNPMAFHPKIGKGRVGDGDRRHNKGCNCKRSGCLKNYCECYEAKIMCSSTCKCVGCKNFEERPELKRLMDLADVAEVCVQQQAAAKTKLSSQISDVPSRPPTSSSGERLPYTFVTTDVAEATCACLLAQLEEADRLKMPEVVQERMVIEEFGRCLMQIIDSANKTKDTPIIPEVYNRQGKTKAGSRILKRHGGGDG
ncbi:protein lin-54 homolog isoform X2 [Liolophura sinensis]